MKKTLKSLRICIYRRKESEEEPLNMQQQEWDREWSQVREESVTGAKSENPTAGWKGRKLFWQTDSSISFDNLTNTS